MVPQDHPKITPGWIQNEVPKRTKIDTETRGCNKTVEKLLFFHFLASEVQNCTHEKLLHFDPVPFLGGFRAKAIILCESCRFG